MHNTTFTEYGGIYIINIASNIILVYLAHIARNVMFAMNTSWLCPKATHSIIASIENKRGVIHIT